jgi:hypothetical protein
VAAGRNTAAAIAVNGSLYTWGNTGLGRPRTSSAAPGLVQGLEGHSMSKVCMGEYHGVAISDAGKAFVWGSMIHHHGDLSDGREAIKDETAAPLKGLSSCTVFTALACGHEHTVLISQQHPSCSPGTTTASAKQPAVEVAAMQPPTAPLVAAAAGSEPVLQTVPANVSNPVASVALAALELLRGGSRVQEPAYQSAAEPDISSHAAQSDSAAVVQQTAPQAAAPFSVELCENGAPRPRWIKSCDDIPENILELDRAWYGRYRAPTLDVVCASSIFLPLPQAATSGSNPSEMHACISRLWSGTIVCRTSIGNSPLGGCHCATVQGRIEASGAEVQVMQSAPDVFEDVLYPWLPSARNPCYLSIYDEVKCLPFLSIIGVSKCGTTDLWHKLMQIPCVPRSVCCGAMCVQPGVLTTFA